jgi:integrase
MNTRQTDAGNKLVWLSDEDITALLERVDDAPERWLSFALGVRCGLRSTEIMDVAPEHVHDTDAGPVIEVPEGKGDKYRETPAPAEIVTRIRTISQVRDEPADAPIIQSVGSTRALRYWIETARDDLAREHSDGRWTDLSYHDLRRTWATHLRDDEVPAELVMDWGGWSDIETFLEHYKGAYSPEAQRKARDKVDWL